VEFRNTILIFEKGNIQTTKIERYLRDKKYFFLRIESPDGFIPLLDSRDRIRAVVFVDDAHGIFEESYLNLKLLKAISQDMPLLFSTGMNTPQKEERVRDLGLFYYHTNETGLVPLAMAIEMAVKKSIIINRFL
jgi:hypothetical protein